MTSSLIRHLRQLEVDAGLLLVGVAGEYATSLEQSGVPTVALGHARGRSALTSPVSFVKAATALGPDAVVLPDGGFLAPLLRVLGYKGKIVSIEHGSVGVQESRGIKGPLGQLEWKFSSRFLDLQIAVSRDKFEQMRVSRAAQKAFVHNGIELPEDPVRQVPEPGGEFTCATLSRVVEGKGIEVAIRAMSRLSDLPQVKLAICGDGEMRRALEDLAARLGVSARVEFVGWTTSSQAWTGASVGLSLSDTLIEGFGMSAMEAMSFGLPVIATRNGALPEFVRSGENGFLVEPRDDVAVASAIRRYATDLDLWTRHSDCATSTSHEFDIRKVAAKYRELLVSVCATGSTHETHGG
jgi:glycosyltransferase involved in cell wall biosynthesis